MPLGKNRDARTALYLHLLVDSDIHLPVFRSPDLHRRITIATSGLRWKSPAVKTRYRLVSSTT